MSLRIKVSTIMGAAALVACTSQGPKAVEVQSPATQGQQTRQGQVGQQGQDQQQGSQQSSAGQIGVTLDKSQLAQYSINTTNLNWTLTYLDAAPQSGTITFDANGQGQIVAKSLPTGRSGTVTLQIFDGQTLKLSGSNDNVTLTNGGTNAIKMILKLASSDLTINVALDPSVTATQPSQPPAQPTQPTQPSQPPAQPTQPSQPPAQPSQPPAQPSQPPAQPSQPPAQPSQPPAQPSQPSQPPAQPSQPTQPTQPPAQPSQPTQAADPIGTWDGQSNQGNSHWQIVPVSN